MKKIITIIILLTASGILFASTSGWSFGYRVGFDGYAADLLSDHEYAALSLYYEPFASQVVTQSIHAGVLLPTRMTDAHGPLLTAGLGSGLFALYDHPLNRFLRRESAIIPRIDAQIMVAMDPWEIVGASALFQPLSLFFGDLYVGVMGMHLQYDFRDNSWGWGVRIFEISHAVW